jgi:hypothetical protein
MRGGRWLAVLWAVGAAVLAGHAAAIWWYTSRLREASTYGERYHTVAAWSGPLRTWSAASWSALVALWLGLLVWVVLRLRAAHRPVPPAAVVGFVLPGVQLVAAPWALWSVMRGGIGGSLRWARRLVALWTLALVAYTGYVLAGVPAAADASTASPETTPMSIVAANAPVQLNPGQHPLDLVGQHVLAVRGLGGAALFAVLAVVTAAVVRVVSPRDTPAA